MICTEIVDKMAGTFRSKLAILIDLSGTIHIENTVVPGAIEALEKLRNISHVNLKFVTNTTKESGRVLHERLVKLGFGIQAWEIYTSLIAAKRFVELRGLRPMLLLENEALEDFQGIDTSNPDTVVIGLAPSHFNYARLNKAFRLIMDGGLLIGIHKARYFKTTDGLALGPGAFVTGLEFSTDKKAIVVGKPEKSFFLDALAGMTEKNEQPISAESAIMIGDDVRDDVGGAQDAGMRGILVKTGKYRSGDEKKIDRGLWRIAESFVEAVEIVENL